MKSHILCLLLLGLFSCAKDQTQDAQDYEQLIHIKTENSLIPVLLRGNLSSGTIILFVQGGPGQSAIDFASIDYPGWKNTLEKDFAIAYYDQTGTGNKQWPIDPAKVNLASYVDDLHTVASYLKQKGDYKIAIMGHSFGGKLLYHYLLSYGNDALGDYYISADGPATSDFDTLRWDFRREFLYNTAQLEIANQHNTERWKEVLAWLDKTPVIRDVPGDDPWRDKGQWNDYVDELVYAYYPEKSLAFGQLMRGFFASPYNPISAYVQGGVTDKIVHNLFQDIDSFKLVSRIQGIDQKILLLTGRFDDICPPEEMEYIHNKIANSELVVIENAGHETFNHQAEEFQQLIRNYIK
ncbi:alpha/beta fold hydrolase [bacterium]|nr:alpha/beta fold hydrolase [bacterium]